MKRILHVLMSSTFSGAENVVCQIISMYKNDDVEMLYGGIDGPVIRNALDERGFKFIPMKKEACQRSAE